MVVAAHTRLGCGGLFGSILTIPTPRHPIFFGSRGHSATRYLLGGGPCIFTEPEDGRWKNVGRAVPDE